jgi:hypothetical protein
VNVGVRVVVLVCVSERLGVCVKEAMSVMDNVADGVSEGVIVVVGVCEDDRVGVRVGEGDEVGVRVAVGVLLTV